MGRRCVRVYLVTERVRGRRGETAYERGETAYERGETAYERGETGLVTGRITDLRTLLIAENRSFER